MTDRPGYLGLLNAISIAESQAHAYPTAWVDVTRDAEIRDLLQRVAARDGEHGMSFAKRINELGFHVQETDAARPADQLACVRSDRADLEKFEYLDLLRFGRPDGAIDNIDGASGREPDGHYAVTVTPRSYPPILRRPTPCRSTRSSAPDQEGRSGCVLACWVINKLTARLPNRPSTRSAATPLS